MIKEVVQEFIKQIKTKFLTIPFFLETDKGSTPAFIFWITDNENDVGNYDFISVNIVVRELKTDIGGLARELQKELQNFIRIETTDFTIFGINADYTRKLRYTSDELAVEYLIMLKIYYNEN